MSDKVHTEQATDVASCTKEGAWCSPEASNHPDEAHGGGESFSDADVRTLSVSYTRNFLQSCLGAPIESTVGMCRCADGSLIRKRLTGIDDYIECDKCGEKTNLPDGPTYPLFLDKDHPTPQNLIQSSHEERYGKWKEARYTCPCGGRLIEMPDMGAGPWARCGKCGIVALSPSDEICKEAASMKETPLSQKYSQSSVLNFWVCIPEIEASVHCRAEVSRDEALRALPLMKELDTYADVFIEGDSSANETAAQAFPIPRDDSGTKAAREPNREILGRPAPQQSWPMDAKEEFAGGDPHFPVPEGIEIESWPPPEPGEEWK